MISWKYGTLWEGLYLTDFKSLWKDILEMPHVIWIVNSINAHGHMYRHLRTICSNMLLCTLHICYTHVICMWNYYLPIQFSKAWNIVRISIIPFCKYALGSDKGFQYSGTFMYTDWRNRLELALCLYYNYS